MKKASKTLTFFCFITFLAFITFSNLSMVNGREMLQQEAMSQQDTSLLNVVYPQKSPCSDCTWPCDPVVDGEYCICRC
ncbi:unnamed protein product [Cochlearia groenlandica]